MEESDAAMAFVTMLTNATRRTKWDILRAIGMIRANTTHQIAENKTLGYSSRAKATQEEGMAKPK